MQWNVMLLNFLALWLVERLIAYLLTPSRLCVFKLRNWTVTLVDLVEEVCAKVIERILKSKFPLTLFEADFWHLTVFSGFFEIVCWWVFAFSLVYNWFVTISCFYLFLSSWSITANGTWSSDQPMKSNRRNSSPKLVHFCYSLNLSNFSLLIDK